MQYISNKSPEYFLNTNLLFIVIKTIKILPKEILSQKKKRKSLKLVANDEHLLYVGISLECSEFLVFD